MKLLVTGGCGFIGSNFIEMMFDKYPDYEIINLDKLTYAGNVKNINDNIKDSSNYTFVHGDICDTELVDSVMQTVDTVVHFAAESHVDKSITSSTEFVTTNVLGTQVLLDSALKYNVYRFVHISTDEVYGSILEGAFKETDILTPASPYSSSKAGSDLLVQSYHLTYNLSTIITRCTNNYGPRQHTEKLISKFITELLQDRKVGIYGLGNNIREWIYVLDHCRAIDIVLHSGTPGEIYNIGVETSKTNLEIAHILLNLVRKDSSYIIHVDDRLGHDFRYAVDCSKINKLGWYPEYTFKEAIFSTVTWYVENEEWWKT